ARSAESADEGMKRERENCLKYLGSDGSEIHWDFIRAVQMSVAALSVIQLQDLLGLGSDARMNTPASPEGNWAWRFRAGALTDELAKRLRGMTALYGRLND
ncbi:MAG TPA: 4-alpha-glucanotransferase, partial [Pyrinomonadaceae bacterium]|nr:4-alpha-glucanotransferase [Pyrinomonadaceae bacterium]